MVTHLLVEVRAKGKRVSRDFSSPALEKHSPHCGNRRQPKTPDTCSHSGTTFGRTASEHSPAQHPTPGHTLGRARSHPPKHPRGVPWSLVPSSPELETTRTPISRKDPLGWTSSHRDTSLQHRCLARTLFDKKKPGTGACTGHRSAPQTQEHSQECAPGTGALAGHRRVRRAQERAPPAPAT